jgi:hypothetical protein
MVNALILLLIFVAGVVHGGSSTNRSPFVVRSVVASPQVSSSTTSGKGMLPSSATIATALRGGQIDVEVSALVDSSVGWTSNLGAPAALIAGAVIATMYENIRSGDLEILESDSKGTRFMKKLTRVLLLTAFGSEILCIFVTTVTGTVLLSRELENMDDVQPITSRTTPLLFLRGNFEFEYLTARITMLQGLFNWLAAIALTHLIPNPDVGKDVVYLNSFIGVSLVTCILLMLSFFNGHMTFYGNYYVLLKRWLTVGWYRFFWRWPLRPLSLLYIPSLCFTFYLGWRAFIEEGYNVTTKTSEPEKSM